MGKRKPTIKQGNIPRKVLSLLSSPAPDIPDYVVVELRYESPVAFTTSKFTAPAAAEPHAETLNNVLAKDDIASMRSHFGLKSSAIHARVDVAATLSMVLKSIVKSQCVERTMPQDNH